MTPTSRNESTNRPRAAYHHRNRPVHIPDGVMAVGLIVGTHGLRGELKVELHTDNESRFAVGSEMLLGEELVEITLATSRPHKGMQLIRIVGVESREQAEDLRGQWLFIPESEALTLEDDAYWIHDIVGMTVMDTDDRTLGTVRNVMETGANDVYIIQAASGINRGKELLLPAIPDVVQQVDLDAGVIRVQLLPGLVDEDDLAE